MRLICNDGTRYTKDVDIVRKCACTKKCYWLIQAAVHNSNTQSPEAPTVEDTFTENHDLNLNPEANFISNLDASSQRILQSARRHSQNSQNQKSNTNNNQPLKLTFFVGDDDNTTYEKHLNDASNVENDSESSNRFYYPDETIDSVSADVKVAKLSRNIHHDPYCVLSAFLYFTTITSFTYLVIIWIKQRMHVQMTVLQWWWTDYLTRFD